MNFSFLGLLTGNLWRTTTIALTLALALCWMGWTHAAHRRDYFKAKLGEVAAAQQVATLKAKQAKEAEERRHRENAERTDREHQKELADANAKLARYIATHRVQDNRGPASGTPASPESGSPESPDGPGGDAIVVTVEDAQICTTNSLRLKAAHEWAKGLSSPSPNHNDDRRQEQ